MTTEDDERARIKAITGSEVAKRLPNLAGVLAFETDLGSDAAAAILAAAGADADAAAANKSAPALKPMQRSGVGLGAPVSTERHMSKELAQASWSKAMSNANRGVESLGAGYAGGGKPSTGWARAVDLASAGVA